MSTEVLVSEIFKSPQGEGRYTGSNSIWIRFFYCNLQCDGFSQTDPTNPDTYELPYKTLDISNVKSVSDLPVVNKGCDSYYSWSKRYKHLSTKYTVSQLVDVVENLAGDTKLYHISNNRAVDRHLCFTGGEPLMLINQMNIVKILIELETRYNMPKHITFETNGTQELSDSFIEYLEYLRSSYDIEFHASISPKLYVVSGEANDRAWNHKVINQYYNVFDKCSLKFVINDNSICWYEIDNYLSKLSFICDYVTIMPVGATVEQQQDISKLVDIAIERGFHISARLHTYIYGNAIGT